MNDGCNGNQTLIFIIVFSNYFDNFVGDESIIVVCCVCMSVVHLSN